MDEARLSRRGAGFADGPIATFTGVVDCGILSVGRIGGP
jgi:hypothetical protein